MKKRKISLCLFLFVSFGLFAAELKAKDVVKEAEKKESIDDALSYVKNQIEKTTVLSEKRSLYIFLGNMQEQLAYYDEAKKSYASAAGIAAANAEGMQKKSNEQLVLDAVRCALCQGDYETAHAYLNSSIRNSKDNLVQSYTKLYTQWAALCSVESKEDLAEPVEILKAYSKVDSMKELRPTILLTLWYVTGEKQYSSEITKSFPKSTEAAIVNGDVQLLPTPFWFFVPKLGEVEQGIGSIVIQNAESEKKLASEPKKVIQSSSEIIKLQLGLFRTEKNAKLLVEELKSKGFDSYVTTEKRASGTTYYIVLIHENKERTLADKLRSSGYECYIVD
jgi:tetratricopeptide (TPR) repeat protein